MSKGNNPSSSIIKPRAEFIVCHLDVYDYVNFLLTVCHVYYHLCLPFIKIITHANDVLNMFKSD